MRTILVSVVVVVGACHHEAAGPPPPPPPPPAPTCQVMVDHAVGLMAKEHGDHPEEGKAIAQVALDHCTKDAWSDGARTCIAAAETLEGAHHCLTQVPEPQRTAFLSEMQALSHPAAKPDPTGPTAKPDDGNGGLPESCVEYRKLMDQYFDCPKIPKDARDAAKQAFEQAWEQWKAMPEDAKPALGEACKAAADAARSMTCPQ